MNGSPCHAAGAHGSAYPPAGRIGVVVMPGGRTSPLLARQRLLPLQMHAQLMPFDRAHHASMPDFPPPEIVRGSHPQQLRLPPPPMPSVARTFRSRVHPLRIARRIKRARSRHRPPLRDDGGRDTALAVGACWPWLSARTDTAWAAAAVAVLALSDSVPFSQALISVLLFMTNSIWRPTDSNTTTPTTRRLTRPCTHRRCERDIPRRQALDRPTRAASAAAPRPLIDEMIDRIVDAL